jgi:hypothetical protein
MSPNVAKANLLDSLKTLRLRWAKVRESWDDEAARQFEAEFIEPLVYKVNAALKGLDHVGEVMAQVRRECAE